MKTIFRIIVSINIAVLLTMAFVHVPEKVDAVPVNGWDIKIEVCGNSLYPNYTVLWEGTCIRGMYAFCYHMTCGYLAPSN